MAGNSVPVFFGAKARTKRPPGIDVTSLTDISASMGPYAAFITSSATIQALETELLNQGVGVVSPNRYSFATGGGKNPLFINLAQIEKPVKVDSVSTRWATGTEILANRVTLPTLSATQINNTEDMPLATNIVSNADRGYLQQNTRIIISSSDEQVGQGVSIFDTTPVYDYRYVGIHSLPVFTISEPAGPNPIPSGILAGFVYTTNTVGTAIYIDGTTINYRTNVPVANVTASGSGAGGAVITFQTLIDRAKQTNGAIYDITLFQGSTANLQFTTLATSLGNVLGKFLFETS